MKVFHILLFIVFLCLFNILIADNFSEKITFSVDKVKVNIALKLIANAADIKIIIDDKLSDNLGTVSYNAENETVRSVLTNILAARGVKINFKPNNEVEITKADPNLKP